MANDLQFKTPQAYKELDTIICKMLRLPEKRKRYHHPLIKAKDLMSDRKEIKSGECLFFINVVRGIDDKQTSYDDVKERRALEQAAKQLFG